MMHCQSLGKGFILHANLQVTIHKPVGLKVVIVLAEGVYELLSHLGVGGG